MLLYGFKAPLDSSKKNLNELGRKTGRNFRRVKNDGSEQEGLVDKSAVGLGERQFHIGIAPGEVSTVALLPGDPFRVPLIAEFLSDVREIAHKREHRTMTGVYKGKEDYRDFNGNGFARPTAIAVEELARVGVRSFIRVGSSAGLQPQVKPGDLLVSEGSLRNDGTTAAYAHPGYPAVPDLRITIELDRQARAKSRRGKGTSLFTPASPSPTMLFMGKLRPGSVS